MISKRHHWILLPASLLVGLVLLATFVKISQNYLSEHLVQNSKALVGQKLDFASLGNHLGDQRLTASMAAPVVLVFWSVTCAPCLRELPGLQVREKDSLIVPINTDPPEQIAHASKIYAAMIPNVPFFHDKNRYLQDSLKIDYLPTHVHLDAQGFIQSFKVGRDLK